MGADKIHCNETTTAAAAEGAPKEEDVDDNSNVGLNSIRWKFVGPAHIHMPFYANLS